MTIRSSSPRGAPGSSPSGSASAASLLIALGSVALVLPVGRDIARLAWALTAVGAFAVPIAAGLLIWLVGDLERREALLIHALQPWVPGPGDRDRRWPIAAIAVLAIVAVIPPSADVPYLFSDHVCQSAELECRWILVQADQLGTIHRDRLACSTTVSAARRINPWARWSSPRAGPA